MAYATGYPMKPRLEKISMNRRTPVSNCEPYRNNGMTTAIANETAYTTISINTSSFIDCIRSEVKGTCILSTIRQGIDTLTRSDERPEAPLREM